MSVATLPRAIHRPSAPRGAVGQARGKGGNGIPTASAEHTCSARGRAFFFFRRDEHVSGHSL
eukprot:2409204-Lingulodinium_polyedra.AAC.1